MKKKICLYGVWGAQKTLQIRGLIERFGADKVGIVSVDDGLPTIESSLDLSMVKHVDSLNDFREIMPWIKETLPTDDYWLCLDGGTRLMYFVAHEHMGRAEAAYDLIASSEPLPAELKRYGKFTTEKERDGHRGFETMGVYGLIGKGIERILDTLKSLPCNIYINFLEDFTESDGRRKLPPLGPDIPGKMGIKAILSTFDFTMRMETKSDGTVTALTRCTGQYLAKTREDRATGVIIPPRIENFNLADFIGLINKTVASDEAAAFNAEPAN